jgi:hypothetical protein
VLHEDVWGSGGVTPHILYIGTSEVSGQFHSLLALFLEKEASTDLTGNWVSPRAGLDAAEKSKISSPTKNLTQFSGHSVHISFTILTEPVPEELGRIILCVLYDLSLSFQLWVWNMHL